MAPKASPKTSKSQATNLQSEAISVDASQEAEAQFLKDLIDRRRKRTTERRDQRKAEIMSKHTERIDIVKSKIAESVEQHKQSVIAIRRPKVQRLLELARKKRELEDRLNESTSELEQAFLSVSNALQLALDGRVNELSS